MCGIVGLFLKDAALRPSLGLMISDMLVTMNDRGPDSAGLAIYGNPHEGRIKITVQSSDPDKDFPDLEALAAHHLENPLEVAVNATHAVLTLPAGKIADARALIARELPAVRIMSVGEAVEIYKEVGQPADVVARFGLDRMHGSHAIGHTRMATESAVTTLGAHPFSTGADQCLVHNGSLSNHNNLRRDLRRESIAFETENDTEVAAAYLTARLSYGRSLGEALEDGLSGLDGFYTFVVGTRSGFGVLRDPIACKPAVLAETDQYVAFGSEYRALAELPGIDGAHTWEPEPAIVYFWEH